MSVFVYIRSEPALWTVGHYDGDGKWQPESDHGSPEDAADRVAYLNGGIPPKAPTVEPTAFVVVLQNGHGVRVYGPFISRADADEFEAFLSAEVDPCTVRELHEPLREVLAWRAAARGDAEEAEQVLRRPGGAL